VLFLQATQKAQAMTQRKTNQNRHDITSPARRKLLQQGFQGALGALLLPVAGSSLLAACGGSVNPSAPATPTVAAVAKTPVLTSVNNFRDVAGADDSLAYQTASGQKLQRGVFYRSNALTPSAADLATLNTLNIKTVYDLRTTAEITATPDTLPTGAAYVQINIIGTSSAAVPTLTSPQQAIAYMEQAEQAFVTDAGECARLGQLFTDLANGANAQLYHCSGGKDRTGWVTAVLLTLMGVPQTTVIQDYLLTNIYSAATIQSTYTAMVNAYGQTYADNFYPMLGVQTSFLMAGLDQVATSYGSMTAYATNGLGLSSATIAQLKAKLLV
jgi:protein-tyrosine phosphatase